LSFSPNDENEILKYINEINQYLNFIENNEDMIIAAMLKNIIVIKNKNWLKKNESPYTIETIKNKVGSIKEISFLGNGKYTIIFDDANIFLGHDIEVTMKKQKVGSIAIVG
jgi:hypothetical protein